MKSYANGDVPSDDENGTNVVSGATSGRKKTT
jgi:hypothetical protein